MQDAMTEFETTLDKGYLTGRDRLATTFPAAHRFLIGLESLCREDPRFHLESATNLNFYVADRFLAYVTVNKRRAGQPVLGLSPTPKAQIKEGTHPDTEVLLPRPLGQLVTSQAGYSAGWAKRSTAEDTFSFTPGTPEAFFDSLLDLIRTVA
jgi:hypothetical protein